MEHPVDQDTKFQDTSLINEINNNKSQTEIYVAHEA